MVEILVGGFSGGSDGKESSCNAGDLGLIPGSGRSPGKKEQLPTPVFLPGEFHGQRSLVGYSPWGHKELDITEQLSMYATSVAPRILNFKLRYLPVCSRFLVHSDDNI